MSDEHSDCDNRFHRVLIHEVGRTHAEEAERTMKDLGPLVPFRIYALSSFMTGFELAIRVASRLDHERVAALIAWLDSVMADGEPAETLERGPIEVIGRLFDKEETE
jgi:hypothetical protein